MTSPHRLAPLALLAALTATACPSDDGESGASTGDATETTETTATTTDATTTDASASETTEPYIPDNCDGCLAGFRILVEDTNMESVVDQIELSYTVDGVDSGKSAKDLCGDMSCAVYETMGELEVSATYGTCTQTEAVNGWLSCGCSASFAPWDPLIFTFDPACLDDA